ncbi:sulfotransferase domain-containing protein [Coleofasciculus sp. E2-BRE-01]|uniref:sulfotransferase domain-containing protein n=1 Tax=Coleofasciculus sp. E2-BRE-01 TaxID=3069524 RepID=UPI0033016B26
MLVQVLQNQHNPNKIITMIIYISSYPRSGNSLIQQIINVFFEKPWTEVYKPQKPLEKITGVPSYFTNWRSSPHPWQPKSTWQLLWDKFNRKILKIYDVEKWIATYDLDIPPYTKNCRYLLPGCYDVLTPKNRQILAAEDTPYFVKTHATPYRQYFEKEYVIQIVRHPGPVCWSYLNLLKDYYNKQKTLDDIISGKTPAGSWSKWHQSWKQAIPSFNGRFMRLKYEDVKLTDRHSICKQIKFMTGIDYNPTREEISFEILQKQAPNYYRAGQNKHWQQHYTSEQINLLYKLHNVTMEELGYD